MDKAYLESSFISYLTSRLSRDLVVAAHQQITQQWWDTRRLGFDLHISRIVVEEVGAGDVEAARERLAVVEGIKVLQLNREALELAGEFIAGGAFPETSAEDALHVAVATAHGMDFLLTWNCRHIANAEMARRAEEICQAKGYEMPRICTPEQLMGE
ncbi:MAG TPA: type II toxin-antitoxin system VapC family toxin [Thermoguttaceae bacterium]|nr:type II toxin-antitoxin system VapC family toxin [Thermoguttaceae bacterium]